MFARIARGWRLAKVSWGVLTSDRSLAAFPILGGIASFFLLMAFGLPAALAFDDDLTVVGVILAGIAIYLSTFAAVFFNVSLAAAAVQVLDGEDATVASGVAVARRHTGAIAGWAGVLASVNIILQAVRDRLGPLGAILAGGIAIIWGLITFMVIPIIAIEGIGPVAAIKRSASIFRERWGEQITGQFTIGFIPMIIALIPAAILVGIGVASGSVAVLIVLAALAALIVVIAAIITAALTQIFAVALYRYAIGEGAVGAFTEQDLATAVGPKSGGGWGS